jgi:phage baseplate assembly protein W
MISTDPIALRFPLTLDDSGRAVTTTDPNAIWMDRAQLLLSTEVEERVGELFYGSRLGEAAFSDIDLVLDDVTQAAQTAFAKWLPECDIHDVQLSEKDPSQGWVVVSIVFTVPSGKEVNLSTKVDLGNLGLG